MTAEQYRRANQKIFIINLVVAIMFWSMTLIGMKMVGVSIGIYMGIGSDVIGTIGVIFGYVKFREERLGGIIILASSAFMFCMSVIFGGTIMLYASGVPILISCILYMDMKLLVIGQTIFTIAPLICLIQTILKTKAFPEEGSVATFVIILSGVAAVESVKLLGAFTRENNEEIEETMEIQQETNDAMAEIAGNISELFAQAQSSIGQLKDIIESTNSGMQDIAESTVNTANAVESQAMKCQDIQDQTGQVDRQRAQMVEASKAAQDTVRDGENVIEGLKEKNENVVRNSRITIESTQAVTKKVENIQDIVGIIVSISSKTNLLSLNASIEAARAGEAGKGFAVVADEIRQLSDQTNTASNQIKTIIGELTADADKAMKSIDETAQSVDEQNELIADTAEKFRIINQNVSSLIECFSEIGNGLETIIQSTTQINESISDLSATSEQIAALSNEGVNTSNEAVSQFTRFEQLLDGIYAQAKQLDEVSKMEQ